MIDWEKMDSTQIVRFINACNPWNRGAGAIINNQVVCLTQAEMTPDTPEQGRQPGTIVTMNEKEGLRVFCTDNRVIRVNIVYVPEGLFPGYRLEGRGIKINDRFIGS